MHQIALAERGRDMKREVFDEVLFTRDEFIGSLECLFGDLLFLNAFLSY